MKKLAVKIVLGLTAVVAACSFLGKQAFKQPEVTLQKVELVGVGLTGGSLNVDLNVYNPNHYRLDATRLTYEVLLNSDSLLLATGAVDNKFTVESEKSSVVQIPVSFTYAGVGSATRSLLNTGVVTYHVRGNVTVGTTVGTFNVPFSDTRQLTTAGVAR
ncbi:MAG TPA: LEA type 2 family protein [Gemmatimonadaceae bacterium]|jgi:LEA14-like dessication related protein|nr:LEA type 2 family protein [Gemmatimonadaceae bacterium]